MRKRLEEIAKGGSDAKRLKEERGHLLSALNQSFFEFCGKADRLSSWHDAARDYELYASDIIQRTSAGVNSEDGGALFTWGSGDCGQLGHGVSDPPIEEEETSVEFPKKVKAFAQSREMRIIQSGGLSNAVVDSKGVWTWGCADDGALGREGDENLPALLHFPSKIIVTALSLGESHGACVALSGQVYMWGSLRDKDGKTFFPTTAAAGSKKHSGPGTIAKNPTELDVLSGILTCASGANHVVFLASDGSVSALGFGDQEQLGRSVSKKFKIPHPTDKDEEDIYDVAMIHREHLYPSKMELGFTVRSIGCGSYHTLLISALRSEVYGCGLNQYQQVAPSDKTAIGITKITALDGKSIKSVRAGEHYSLALSADGTVYTWGRSDQGQLGRSAVGDDKAGSYDGNPAPLKSIPPVAQIACGSSHILARTRAGEVYSWGFGEMLQLGHGENATNAQGQLDQTVPKRIEKLKGLYAFSISAGAQHSCALVGSKRDDEVA